MNTMSLKNTSHNNSVASMLTVLAVTLGLFMASPVPASAQELFALSTESGLELYQVEGLKGPDFIINKYHSALEPKIEASAFSKQFRSVKYGKFARSLLVNSGLQTTPNGRILTMAGHIDWQPTSGGKTSNKDLVASLK